MNTGIQDGYNLAWKLAIVLKGAANEKLLATYNEERSRNAKNLLSTTDRFFEFAASDEWLISFVRNNIFPYVFGTALSFDIVKSKLFSIVSQIGISYEDQSLSAEAGGFSVKAGDRMPWFSMDGKSIYESLNQPSFHLLTFGADIDASDKLPEAVRSKFQAACDTHAFDLDKAASTAFGCDEPFVVLLRPDNYIGYLSRDLSAIKLEEYLTRY